MEHLAKIKTRIEILLPDFDYDEALQECIEDLLFSAGNKEMEARYLVIAKWKIAFQKMSNDFEYFYDATIATCAGCVGENMGYWDCSLACKGTCPIKNCKNLVVDYDRGFGHEHCLSVIREFLLGELKSLGISDEDAETFIGERVY